MKRVEVFRDKTWVEINSNQLHQGERYRNPGGKIIRREGQSDDGIYRKYVWEEIFEIKRGDELPIYSIVEYWENDVCKIKKDVI